MNKVVPILIIDEDETIVSSLKTLIPKILPKNVIFTAKEGTYAFDFLQKNNKPSIIMCDQHVLGINGFQLLKKIKSDDNFAHHHFIMMMRGQIDKELNIKTIQAGADGIMNKPFSIDKLIEQLVMGAKMVNMRIINQEDNKKYNEISAELNLQSTKIKELFVRLLNSRIPGYDATLKRQTEAAMWLMNNMSNGDHKAVEQISIAVSLSQVGRLLLPENMIQQPILKKGIEANATMAKVPSNAKELLSSLRGFEEITAMVEHIYENYDGSGIPDKLQGPQIPLGARIIRAIVDYEELFKQSSNNETKAMEALYFEDKRLYDYRVIAFLDQYWAYKGQAMKGGREISMKLPELESGMTLTRTLVTSTGMKILTVGTVLQDDKIQKLMDINRADPILGSVYVRKI